MDLKVHDDRPIPKDVPGADIMNSRVDPKIDLDRTEELFDGIQVRLNLFSCALN